MKFPCFSVLIKLTVIIFVSKNLLRIIYQKSFMFVTQLTTFYFWKYCFCLFSSGLSDFLNKLTQSEWKVSYKWFTTRCYIWVLTNMWDGLFNHIQQQCLHSFIVLWIHFFFGDWELEALQICCIFAEMREKEGEMKI